MELSYNGFHQEVASFEGDAALGDLVCLNANGRAAKAGADQDFIGICVSKRGELLGVQLCGAAETAYSGSAPALGYTGLLCGGENAVKAAANGRKLLVLQVDQTKKKAVFLL